MSSANIVKEYDSTSSDSDSEDEVLESGEESEQEVESEQGEEKDLLKTYDLADIKAKLDTADIVSSSDDEDENDEFNASDSEAEEADNSEGEEDGSDNDGEETKSKGAGWADAMAKVLNTGKRSADQSKPVILSKAKKDYERASVKKGKEAVEGDVDGKDKDQAKPEKEQQFLSAAKKRALKKEKDEKGRKKPCIAKDRVKERRLVKVATRGVVQLFNAVREQQKTLKSQLAVAGQSTTKRDKVFQSLDKETFLEVLSGQQKKNKRQAAVSDQNPAILKKAKHEVKLEAEDDDGTWSVLKDDFMMGAKMKDWDRDSNSD